MVPKKYCFKTQIHVQMMVRRIMYRINYANVDETFFYTNNQLKPHENKNYTFPKTIHVYFNDKFCVLAILSSSMNST